MRNAALSLLALAAPFFARGQDPPRYLKHLIEATEERVEEKDLERLEEIDKAIARITGAIESENMGELEECLIRRKIYLALGTPSEDAGYYGRSQIKFMFGKLFRERQTRSFTYDARELEPPSEDSAYFRAAWTYVVLDDDEVVTESLRFKLERSAGEWRISEIRAAAR